MLRRYHHQTIFQADSFGPSATVEFQPGTVTVYATNYTKAFALLSQPEQTVLVLPGETKALSFDENVTVLVQALGLVGKYANGQKPQIVFDCLKDPDFED